MVALAGLKAWAMPLKAAEIVTPETTKPTGATVGESTDRAEPSTKGVYIDSVSDEDWESAVLAVVKVAGGDSERGERARRAVHNLCSGPFVSRPMWTAAESLAWVFVAAVLSADDDLRARANAQVKTVLTLAAESRASLGRAA